MKRKSAFQALNKAKVPKKSSLESSLSEKSDNENASPQSEDQDSSFENQSIESYSQKSYESLESSDSDSSNNDEGSISPKSTVQISNFTPTKSNINYMGSAIVAGMNIGESLVFQGQYMLTVQKGSVNIYGATLHVGSKRYKISASAATALPKITASPTKKKYIGKVIETPENSFLTQSPDEISTIILIESLNTGLEEIPYIIPKFQNLWGPQLSSNSSEMFRSFHPIYTGPSSIKTVESYDSWKTTAAEIVSDFKSTSYPTVVFVTGPKNSGKSTFCRFLLNYTLSALGKNSVHYLDCDPGQPEYSPPGNVYLSAPQSFNFSSPFSHPNFEDVIESFSLGHSSPKDVPLLYSACFQALFSLYKSLQTEQESSILIVNTPGWTKGLGLELLVEMMKISQFTHAVFLGADDLETFQDFNNRVLSIIESDDQYQKIYTPDSFLRVSSTKSSVHHSSRQYTASDMRTLQLLCYFHYNFQTHSFDFEKSFAQLPFFSVPVITPPHFAQSTDKNENLDATHSEHDQDDQEEDEEIDVSQKQLYAPNELLSLYHSEADSNLISSLLPNAKKQPKEVRQSARIAAFGIMAAEGLNLADVALCLEGTVLAILAVKDYVFSQLSPSLIPAPVLSKKGKTYIPWIPPNHITTVLSPSITRCLGLAVVRNIDSNSVTLQSPIDPKYIDELESTNEKIVLLRGRLDMPTHALSDLSGLAAEFY